jgi:hypothetical protein
MSRQPSSLHSVYVARRRHVDSRQTSESNNVQIRGDGQHQEIVSPLDSPFAHFGNGLATIPIGRKRAGMNRAAAAARHFGLLAELGTILLLLEFRLSLAGQRRHPMFPLALDRR